MNISDRFKEFIQPNKFSRVDVNHILELHIGLDEKCRKSIELRAKYKPRKVISSGSIEVNQYKKDAYNTIRFSLCNEEVSGLFYKFCDDLIEQTRGLKDESEGYQAIVNRYYQWKKLFTSKGNNLLSESEVMGLIGEILFLQKYLKSTIGLEEGLSGWSGQELTHKDFSYQDCWYEVKTVSSGKNTVKISSIEQLESDVPGELAVYKLEKMSEAYDGISLNKLILDTTDMLVLQDDKDKFLNKVVLRGYMYNNYYDTLVFEVKEFVRYKVCDGFPVLTRNNLPEQIVKVSYEIDLAQIRNYIIKRLEGFYDNR